MPLKQKRRINFFFTVLMITLIFYISINLNFNRIFAQAPGIIVVISSNTTWTKADSPHVLTGPVLVSNGVTLSVDAGATVDFNGYYLLVNGTFRVMGSASDPIQLINGEKIEFTKFSNGWNEQTGLGCIIKVASVTFAVSSSVSLKLDTCDLASLTVEESTIISNSEIGGRVKVGSSSEISDSFLGEHVFVGNSSAISNNNITGNVIGACLTVSNNTIMGHVNVDESTVSDNIIRDGISGTSLVITRNNVTVQEKSAGSYVIGGAAIRVSGDSSLISGNVLDGGGVRFDMGYRGSGTIGTIDVGSNSAVISDNVIEGTGIYLIRNCDSVVIENNTINSGIFCKLITWEGIRAIFNVTSLEISGNEIRGTIDVSANSLFVTNNTQGICCKENPLVIQNNTITENEIGIIGGSSSTIVQYNNIENNTERSIYLEPKSDNVDARNNWWGTTNAQAINLTIHDYKYEFGLGTVTFVPFLTESNPEAMPDENVNFSSPTIPEFSSWIVLPLFLVVLLGVVICKHKIEKRISKGSHILSAY